MSRIASDPPTSIAIVMPALNEEAAIGAHLRALRAHPALQELPLTRLIVVDNGSEDGTASVARAFGAEVVREPQRGYGAACLAGVRAAKGADIVLFMDADGSDDPAGAAHIASLVLAGDTDLAVGSRTRGTAQRGALVPHQRAGNALGAALLHVLYGARVSDIGPVRAIRREALLRLDMREMGYGWSVEMLAKAARAGLRIREAPVDYRRRAGGKSKVAGSVRGTLKASFHILRTLYRYRRWQPAPTATTRARQSLLIVARLPIPGTTKTRLGAFIGHDHAAALYGAFLRDLGSRFTGASSRDGYDLYWYYTAPDGYTGQDFAAFVPPGGTFLPQRGDDFATRLWHGFHALAARGYGRIVVVGSDTPHLPAAYVSDAFAALDTHDLVIGQASDGGYYLLGQRSTPMPVDLFTGIQMSTPRVHHETLQRARSLGLRIASLSEAFDVDEPDALPLLRETLTHAPSADADAAPETLAALEALASKAAERARAPEGVAKGAARAHS